MGFNFFFFYYSLLKEVKRIFSKNNSLELWKTKFWVNPPPHPKTKMDIIGFIWPANLFKLLQTEMFVANFKKIGQRLWPQKCSYIGLYIKKVLKKLSNRIDVHFTVPGLNLTTMVVWLPQFSSENLLINLYINLTGQPKNCTPALNNYYRR